MLKTTSGSSPRTDLSSNITFSQPKSHATVPLRRFVYTAFKVVLLHDSLR
jgi:hypothetical protein